MRSTRKPPQAAPQTAPHVTPDFCRRLHLLASICLCALTVPSLHGGPGREELDPRRLHVRIRGDALAGRDLRKTLQDWEHRSGDQSFDSFRIMTEGKRLALQVQREAFEAWDRGDRKAGLRLLGQAARRFQEERSPAEAAFCLYYQAEIEAEREQYLESLLLLDSAMNRAQEGSSRRHYLLSLVHQSRGYSLWYLDQLRESIVSFGRAQRHFEHLDYREGLVTSWNNLAILLEELQIRDRALDCYREAEGHLSPSIDRRIRFKIHSNFARFLKTEGMKEEALRQLEKARESAAPAGVQALLLEVQLLGNEALRQRLLQSQPGSIEERVDRLLVLADTETNTETAHRYFSLALELCSPDIHRFLRRQVVTRFGRRLESEKRFREAELLYGKALAARPPSRIPEYLFPFSRADSALFDGWIRSLVALGRQGEALDAIRRVNRHRMFRAHGFIQALPREVEYKGSRMQQLALASQVETPFPGKDEAEMALEEIIPEGFTVLNLWPDGKMVWVWIDNPLRDHFLELKLSRPVRRLIRETLEPLYDADGWLPSSPPKDLLRRIHEELFEPLEGLFESTSLLVLANRDLQALPLEMLVDKTGTFLLERYSFAYLPSQQRSAPGSRTRGRPLMLFPGASSREPATEEAYFREAFPDARFHRGFPEEFPDSTWIHLSSHFLLEKDLWLSSSFRWNNGRLSLSRLLRHRLSCNLLSIGACDVANSYGWGAPYWLGIPELVLAAGVPALLVSRWKLDEQSLSIYSRFIRNCQEGVPMDRALQLARLDFVRGTLHRGNASTPASHPFFWAGLSYVGVPGATLVTPPLSPSFAGCLFALLLPLMVRLVNRHGPNRRD